LFLLLLVCVKALTAEEKQYYEREADKHNGMNPVDPAKDDEDDEEDMKRQPQNHNPYDPAAQYPGHDMTGGYPPLHAAMHPSAAQHDPRHHAAYYYGHGYYDYGGHHHQQQHSRSRSHQYQYPPQPAHGYGEYK
jgi:hypothetical protein